MNYTDIIALIHKKDPASLEELYTTYGKRFYAYCIQKWGCSEDEAWEIVYKTLETLVVKLGGYEFESKAHFENFLYKVLLNFIRQAFRSSRNKQAHQFDLVDFNDEVMPMQIDEYITSASLSNYYMTEEVDSAAILNLNEALQRMDEIDKDILLLRAQNYSYEEIAGFLGIEDNQLKVKHHRAKKKLISILSEIQKTKP